MKLINRPKNLFILILTIIIYACSPASDTKDGEEMREILYKAKEQNQSYIPFTSDTLILSVAKYFDMHGTANERLLAHYLLGCTYRDLNDVPYALQCYQDAIEQADTLSPDCDYTTLMSVYGQMSELFYLQNMPEEQIKMLRQYGHYANIAKDTLNLIRSYELMVGPYDLLGDTSKIIECEQNASKLYEKYGYHQASVGASTATILIEINRNNLSKAHDLMTTFELESGLFDKNGNIQRDRIGYYYIKGKYNLQSGKLDSAEYYYKKLIGSEWEKDAYRGLINVYSRKAWSDSVLKYSILFEGALDTLHNQTRINSMQQVVSMYDYSRYKKIANNTEKKLSRIKIIITLLSIFVTIIIFLGYRKHTLSKKNEKERLVRKEAELKTVQSKLEGQETMLKQLKTGHRLSTLTDSETVKLFHQKAIGKRNETVPSDSEWDMLIEHFAQCLPELYHYLIGGNTLSHKEFQTIILVCLKFTTGEIAILLNTTQQRITNIKSRTNRKLFQEEKAGTLFSNLKSSFL